ncbi:uncharacterized protein LOC128211503 [Mya arenaria]|uniref:uncharacterized protein LOC128211503 n=1 Tax=Mya arenaria TaxID=6604 RepID=UPI0022E3DC8F|nr:uncharacterized protein LOC128211503 [Mya arenaria]
MATGKKLTGCFPMLFIVLSTTVSVITATTPIQNCWHGEDELKNMTCHNGAVSDGNMLAARLNPSMNGSSTGGGSQVDGGDYYCMIFQYNETIKDSQDTVAILHTNYTCDMDKICEGKDMYSPITFSYKDHMGMLYCCESRDNCNTHGLMTTKRHQKYCYTGDSDTQDVEIHLCPKQNDSCMKVAKTQGSSSTEHYGCDVTGACSKLGFTGEESCKTDTEGDMETQTCCCSASNCFKPSWANHPRLDKAQSKHSSSQLQKTLLIIIGVALGVLLMGVAVFFYKRSRNISDKSESPAQMKYESTMYSTVAETEDDRVQILQSSCRPI